MIKVENLKKAFGPKRAVNGISFRVERGEILGFLGPNGAGKSTTMRMITGFIPPDEGNVSVGGHDLARDPIQAKKIIGYLPENAPSYNDMTVYGFLAFTADLRGLSGDSKKKAVHRAVEMCFLEPVMHQSVDTLSKGYRHRTCLAQSLLHDPEVRTLIRNMGERKAIIFSTHILEEVESVCTRAIIIDRGQIVANGTPQELKARADNAGAVTLTVANGHGDTIKEKLATLPGALEARLLYDDAVKSVVRITPKDKSNAGALARAVAEIAQRESWALQELHTEEGRLDDVFRSITLPDSVKEKRQ
jgi:ABC-2 type transport system ATP-binding protein